MKSVEDIVKLTGMRSAYFCRIRSASALRFSNGCSSLNLDRILAAGLYGWRYRYEKSEGTDELRLMMKMFV